VTIHCIDLREEAQTRQLFEAREVLPRLVLALKYEAFVSQPRRMLIWQDVQHQVSIDWLASVTQGRSMTCTKDYCC
jgi:hypothetical protein